MWLIKLTQVQVNFLLFVIDIKSARPRFISVQFSKVPATVELTKPTWNWIKIVWMDLKPKWTLVLRSLPPVPCPNLNESAMEHREQGKNSSLCPLSWLFREFLPTLPISDELCPTFSGFFFLCILIDWKSHVICHN